MTTIVKLHRWPRHDNRNGRIECEYEDRCLDCDLLKRTPGPRQPCRTSEPAAVAPRRMASDALAPLTPAQHRTVAEAPWYRAWLLEHGRTEDDLA